MHRSEAVIRLCKRATMIDPNYALAWTLVATAQGRLRHERPEGESGLEAAERALAIDNNLAEAHAAKSEYLRDNARYDEARAEIETALRLDPESYEVNYAAARLSYSMRKIPDAIRHFEKAAALMDSDFGSVGMLLSCYRSIGDEAGARRSAQRTLERAEKVIATEPDNGSAMGFAVGAHSVLGNVERARDWAKRAVAQPRQQEHALQFRLRLLDPGADRRSPRPARAGDGAVGHRARELDEEGPGFRRDPQSPALQSDDRRRRRAVG